MIWMLGLLAMSSPELRERPRVVVLDLRNDGLDESEIRIAREALTAAIATQRELEVLSADDVRRVVDAEAERIANGCAEVACLSELADALGADVIVFGNLGKMGDLVVGGVTAVNMHDASAIARKQIEARAVEELPALLRAAGRSVALSIARPAQTLLWSGAVVSGVGAAVVVTGAGFTLAALGENAKVGEGSSLSLKQQQLAADEAQALAFISYALYGIGAITVVVGAALMLIEISE